MNPTLKTDKYGNIISNSTGQNYSFTPTGDINYNAQGTAGATPIKPNPTGTPAVGSVQYDIANNLPLGTSASGNYKPTVSDVYGTGDATYDSIVAGYKKQADSPDVTAESLMADKMKLYQAEIDAVNKIYTDKIQTAKVAGQGRLGSSRASQARSGLLGSDFGASQTANVETQNQQIEDAYRNENAVQIQAIIGKARGDAVAEAEEKRVEKEQGAKSYIEFLTGAEARKKDRITDLAKSLIAQGKDIKSLTDADLATLATSYGTTKDNILATFNTEKIANDKALADLQKNQPDTSFTLSQGQERFVLDPKTGQYSKVASTAKTYAPSSTEGTGTTGNSTAYGSDLDAVIGATLSTIPSKFGQQTFQSQISKARNDGDKLNLVASQVLKGASAEIRNDFSNQAIAMKQLDKAIAELDAGVKSGFLNSKAQYVAGVFGKDYDPKLQKVQAYITSAVQPYRNSVTGAAWGTQEDNEYADLFGSIKYSPTELKNRLTNMKETLKSKSATSLNTFVNPLGTYRNQFEIGQFAPAQGQTTSGIKYTVTQE